MIWKEIAGKKISRTQAKTLLAKGKTSLIKGFKSKAGKAFEAILVLGKNGRVEFEFNAKGKLSSSRSAGNKKIRIDSH